MKSIVVKDPAFRRHRCHAIASLLVIATFLLVGCAIKLIGDYDETIDTGVSDVQQKAELYLTKLQSSPNTPYDQAFYDEVNARLAVLTSRASSLPKYPIIVQQLGNLRSQFDTLQKLDKSSARPFPSVAATDAEAAIAVSVESILKLELALKDRGKASPPGLSTK